MPSYSTLRKNVNLRPGQILRFQKGRGYYAAPDPNDPLRPLSRGERQRLLDSQVEGALAPQRADLANQRRRTIELAKALAELDTAAGPATSKAYQDAASTIGGLAGGFTGAARTAAEADAAAAAAELARLGAPQEQIDAVSRVGQGAENATYAVGGAIPATALAREGAAFASAANLLPSVARGRGQMAVLELDRLERELDKQIPGIRREYRNDLINQEFAKEEGRLKRDAQALYESQFGLDVVEAREKARHNTAQERAAARRSALAEKQYQLQLKKNQQALTEAEAEGRQPNASLSKAYGYIVDQNGKAILRNGKRIPVGKKGGSGLTPYQQQQVRAAAVQEARELRGEPKERSELEQQDGQGKYIDRNGRPTNDKKKAQYDTPYTFGEAMQTLMSAYGLKKAQARAYLMQAGWKPPRPKKKPKPKGR